MMNTEDIRKIEDTELEQVSGGTGETVGELPKEINGYVVVRYEDRKTCPGCSNTQEDLDHANGGELCKYGRKWIVRCSFCDYHYVYFEAE